MQKHSLLRIEFHSSESNRHIISTNMERKKKDRKALFILQLKSRTDALELVYQHKGEKCHDLLIQIRGKKIGPGLSTLNISCKAFRLSTAFSKPITYGNSIKVTIWEGHISCLALDPPVINQCNENQVIQNVKINRCEKNLLPMLTRCSCNKPLQANVAGTKP